MSKPMTAMIWLVACLASSGAFAQELQVQRPVPYSEDNDISDAIKNECKIGEVLADSIKSHSPEKVKFIGAGDSAGDRGRVLRVEIVDAVSAGNAFIGHQKFTKIKGTLLQDGVKVASFKARRNSMGGAFAGFKGSCAVLDRTVNVLGEDIGEWLKSPKDGVALGN